MKITNLAAERNFLYNINDIETRLLRLQDQSTKGKLILIPQDDPVGTERSISLNHHLAQSKQFLRNLDRAKMFMEEREHALGEMTGLLCRVYELTLSACTGTTSDNARFAIAKEIEGIRDSAKEIADREVEGRRVLVGTLPSWEVSPGIVIAAQDLQLLMDDVKASFDNLCEAFNENDISGIEAARKVFRNLDDAVLAERVKNGAVEARLNILENRIISLDLEYEKVLSKEDDIDLAESVIRLKITEAALSAALAVGAALIQPTLLDYLR